MHDDPEDLELDLLLEGIARRYGYDFRNYARRPLRRRVDGILQAEGLRSISELQGRVLHDSKFFERFVIALSVSVTTMFRDPGVYAAFRAKVVPMLRTYPYLRIWHAGCATGEEVYSLAILLWEEQLYDRCRLYATDISAEAVRRAKRGVFSLDLMQRYSRSYYRAGGSGDFSSYYRADSEHAVMSDGLRRNLVFSQHSLVSDRSFNEFHVIFCRNVLIYFDAALRGRVHDLLYESLGLFGLLVLGLREAIAFTPHAACYETVDAEHRIYRRNR